MILKTAIKLAISKNNIFKALLIFNFLLLTYSLVVLKSSRIMGYEDSIYTNISFYVKISFFFVAISSVLIVLNYLLVAKQSLFYVYLALISLFLVRIIILCIPYIRGYVGWEADHLTHYGIIMDIIRFGDIGIFNMYPMMHIFLSEVSLMTGIYSLLYFSYSNLLISVLYILGIYILSKILSNDKNYSILALLSIIIVIFDRNSVYTTPNAWSILLMPFVFYLYFKVDWNFKVLLLLMIGLYSYIHPISSIYVALSIIIMYLIDIFYVDDNYKIRKIRTPYNILFILLILFVPWVLSFKFLQLRFRSLIESLVSPEDVVSPLSVVGDTASRLDIQMFELSKVIIKSMGDDLIFCLIPLILLAIYLLRFRFNYRLYPFSHEMRKIFSIFSFIGIVYLLYLSGISKSLTYFQPGRILSYHQTITPLIVAFFFYNLLKCTVFDKKSKCAIILIIIMVTSLISISSLYPSNYTYDQNWGVKEINVKGMSWFVHSKNQTIENIRILVLPTRYSSVIIGDRASRSRMDLRSTAVPDHFNYTTNRYLGDNYETNKYLSLFELEKRVYANVWKNTNRFEYDDFEMVDNDKSVFKLYSNGEYTTYYIYSI